MVAAATIATGNEIVPRDYLRGHPAEVARYGALKRTLATQVDGDSRAYTCAKPGFVQELVDTGRHDRGFPLVPVWEE